MSPIIKTFAYLFWLALPLLFAGTAQAQNQQIYAIQPLPLEVSESQTVSLSFPAAVKNVDRGSAGLLAQKAKGTENVVLIKAALKQMQPTSLIVITADGELHTFQVSYRQQPSSIGLQILPKNHKPPAAQITQVTDQSQIDEGLRLALAAPANLNRRGLVDDFALTVEGFYILGPVMYLRLSLENRSVIDYDIQTLRLLVADNKQIKRSASQQDELPLIGKSAQLDQIKASQQQTLVVALNKTALPKSKSLLIQLTEQGGGRSLAVRLKAKHLARLTQIAHASSL